MRIDLHAHSSGISQCCRASYQTAIQAAIDAHLDGIVLTNHYHKDYVRDGDYAAFARRYTDEFRRAKAYGETVGCKVFFGAEVTMDRHDNAHVLIYGIDEAFIEANPTLFDLAQDEFYRLVKSAGGTVVQAHPYRKNVDAMLDLAYLDGIELSCHPKYEGTHEAELYALAQKNQKALTCGGDYHADTHRPRCGVYLPQEITTPQALAQYLANAQTLTLCVQEVDSRESHDVVYTRNA